MQFTGDLDRSNFGGMVGRIYQFGGASKENGKREFG